jgi:hypothetical protein
MEQDNKNERAQTVYWPKGLHNLRSPPYDLSPENKRVASVSRRARDAIIHFLTIFSTLTGSFEVCAAATNGRFPLLALHYAYCGFHDW